MKSASDLLNWAPSLPDEVIERLDLQRSEIFVSARNKANPLLRKHRKVYYAFPESAIQGLGVDLGPWLSADDCSEISFAIITGTIALYRAIVASYLEIEYTGILLEPKSFLQDLCWALIDDAVRTFGNVTTGAWFQATALPSDDTHDYRVVVSPIKYELADHFKGLGEAYEGDFSKHSHRTESACDKQARATCAITAESWGV